jgi:hypothetical protein
MRNTAIAWLVFLASCQSAETENEKSGVTETDTTMTSTTATSDTAVNALTAAEKADGFELLFDGNSIGGWHVFNKKSDGSAWKVQDGTIHLDNAVMKEWQTVGGGDLISEKEYGNFHLKLDWKVDTAGNSGIILFVKEEPKYEHSWHTGPEMQVLDNERHPDSKIIKHRAGDLYDLITSSPETVKPALEWNHVEIISKDGNLEFYLNGSKVLQTTLWDDAWKKLLAGSKFKDMPDFGRFKSGHIGLQDHGNKVWYRNIKIKSL